MLTSSREPAWGDAHPMWEVAERLVNGGHIDIKTRWPDDIPLGRDQQDLRHRADRPGGRCTCPVPRSRRSRTAFARDDDTLVRPLATHLGPSALGALAAVLFFLLLGDLGCARGPRARAPRSSRSRRRRGSTRTIRTRRSSSSRASSGCSARRCARCDDPSRREALWLGAWAGHARRREVRVRARVVGAAVMIGWTLRARREDLKRVALWAAVAGRAVPRARARLQLRALGLDHRDRLRPVPRRVLRRQHLRRRVGHARVAEQERAAVLAAARARAARRAGGVPREAAARVRDRRAVRADVPRVLHVSLVERRLRVGPAVLRVDGAAAARRRSRGSSIDLSRAKRAVAAAVSRPASASSCSASSLYWDHFIRIAIDAKNQWLGQPNRAGSYIAGARPRPLRFVLRGHLRDHCGRRRSSRSAATGGC